MARLRSAFLSAYAAAAVLLACGGDESAGTKGVCSGCEGALYGCFGAGMETFDLQFDSATSTHCVGLRILHGSSSPVELACDASELCSGSGGCAALSGTLEEFTQTTPSTTITCVRK